MLGDGGGGGVVRETGSHHIRYLVIVGRQVPNQDVMESLANMIKQNKSRIVRERRRVSRKQGEYTAPVRCR